MINTRYDLYNITKPIHIFSIRSSLGQNISLGSGVNLDNPSWPLVATYHPFLETEFRSSVVENPIPVDRIAVSTTSFIEDVSDEELSHVLSADLSASFPLGSGNAYLDLVRP